MIRSLQKIIFTQFNSGVLIRMNTNKPTDTDNYIARFPKHIQEILQQMRSTIKKAAPKAEEVISYNMPAYKLNKILVYFAAYKNHIGFYPTSSPIKIFKDKLTSYKTSKGAIQFPINNPLPTALITKIVKFRMKENLQKVKTKKK